MITPALRYFQLLVVRVLRKHWLRSPNGTTRHTAGCAKRKKIPDCAIFSVLFLLASLGVKVEQEELGSFSLRSASNP